MRSSVGDRRERLPVPFGVGRRRQDQRTGKTGFGAAAVGFVLITALVLSAATGVFVLFDPRAQAFWGTRMGDLASGVWALVRAVLER